MKRRVGIMGGTFDPIHIGHLVLAIEACQQRDLDAVIVVPARDPWQKGTVVASAERRLDMVNCAIAGHDQLLSSIVDLEREGPSYAIDTIDDLAKQYPDVYGKGCSECHHDAKGQPIKDLKNDSKVEKCIDCHKKVGEAPKGKDAPKLDKKQKLDYHAEAMHDNCIGCHKDFNKKHAPKKAPVTCNDCHPKK